MSGTLLVLLLAAGGGTTIRAEDPPTIKTFVSPGDYFYVAGFTPWWNDPCSGPRVKRGLLIVDGHEWQQYEWMRRGDTFITYFERRSYGYYAYAVIDVGGWQGFSIPFWVPGFGEPPILIEGEEP